MIHIYTNIEFKLLNNMKILVDENLDGMDDRLKDLGYDAQCAKTADCRKKTWF